MTVLIAASAIFTLIGLLFLGSTLRAVRRGRLLRASSSFVTGAMSVCLGAIAALLPAPAPVTTRLLPGDDALFANADPQPGLV